MIIMRSYVLFSYSAFDFPITLPGFYTRSTHFFPTHTAHLLHPFSPASKNFIIQHSYDVNTLNTVTLCTLGQTPLEIFGHSILYITISFFSFLFCINKRSRNFRIFRPGLWKKQYSRTISYKPLTYQFATYA